MEENKGFHNAELNKILKQEKSFGMIDTDKREKSTNQDTPFAIEQLEEYLSFGNQIFAKR